MGSLEVKVNENIVHKICGILLKQYSGTFIINFKRMKIIRNIEE